MSKSRSYFNHIVKLHNILWARIIGSSRLSDETLQFLRLLLPGLYLLFYMPSYNWIARLPDAWYDPPPLSLAAPFSGFPSLLFFQLTHSGLILCLGALMVGIKPRFTGLCFCGLHILITSFEYSVGKIDHVAHLLIIAFFCFSLGNWGSRLTDKSFKIPIPCSTLLAVLLAFGMFTAGFEKAIRWLDFNPNTSGFLSWHFSGFFNLERNLLAAPYVSQLPQIALEFLDYSAVVFELCPLLCLILGRKFWLLWCMVACSFHAGTTAMLNISFPYQLLGYLPFLIPPILSAHNLINKKYTRGLIIGLVLYRLLAIWVEPVPLLRELLLPNKLSMLSFDLIVWLALVTLGAYTFLRTIRSATSNP